MSRVYLRGNTWWIDYRDERGVRRRRPLPGVLTKRQAQAELAEKVAQLRRRDLGLEATPISLRSTVWELVDWWLKHRCPKPSKASEGPRLTKHIKGCALGDMPAAHVGATHFEARFAELARGDDALSGVSINHIRAKLRTVFEAARREGIYNAANPLADTKKRKETKREPATLTPEQVVAVLRFSRPWWRGFFAACFYLGLRKGEAAALRKGDVDLEAGTVTVRRSWERDHTKTGHVAVLPIPALMVPHLQAAMKGKGELLFPDRKGRMLKRESDPHLRLRSAMQRAGIKLDRAPGIHDLRHSTATVLLRAGVDVHRVQRILRHADVRTTVERYAHLVPNDLRASLEALGTNAAQITVVEKPPKRRGVGKR